MENRANVKLTYNPYLMETEVLFDGHTPGINSAVNRHLRGPLQKWIRDIPKIFHDEMNGYDFDLEFVGTKRDYVELKQVFADAYVDDSLVHIIHRKELKDAVSKKDALEQFFVWVQNNPNDLLDKNEFNKLWEELFDVQRLKCIAVSDEEIPFAVDKERYFVKSVSDVADLSDERLTYTPILFCLKSVVDDRFQVNLEAVLEKVVKSELQVEQLFFWISPSLNQRRTVRAIKDIGVPSPQVFTSLDDERIERFYDVYLHAQDLSDSIKELSQFIARVGSNWNEKQMDYRAKEQAIDNELLGIQHEIDHWNNETFNTDHIGSTEAFSNCLGGLTRKINGLDVEGIKTGDKAVANSYANLVNGSLRTFFAEYIRNMNSAGEHIRLELQRNFQRKGMTEVVFFPRPAATSLPPNIVQSLLACYRLENDGWMRPQMVPYWYKEDWRNHAKTIAEIPARNFQNRWTQALMSYNKSLWKLYKQKSAEKVQHKIDEMEVCRRKKIPLSVLKEKDKQWHGELLKQWAGIERK